MHQPLPSNHLVCPSCGSAGRSRHLYSKNGCDIFRCAECGLGRTDCSGFDPATYYTDAYFSGGHADGYADYLGAEHVLRREFARTVDFIRRYRGSGRLLEIGCAYGFFLQEASRHFDVAGIEIAEDAVSHCRRNGLKVIGGAADEATLKSLGKMDVIVLLDVIEHLPDPHGTLALCAQSLNPGGAIVVTTGDFSSWLARLSGPAWRLMTPPQHLWFFSAESFARHAAGHGLTVAGFDHPWKVVPLSLVAFQLARMLGLRPKPSARASGIGVPVNLFDAMRIVLRRPGGS